MEAKDCGDVTISPISSNVNDGYKIRWLINKSHAEEYYNGAGSSYKNNSLTSIKSVEFESKPVTLWGCNWTLKLKGKRRFKLFGVYNVDFKPKEAELWAEKCLKTKSALTFKLDSDSRTALNYEERATPNGGYKMWAMGPGFFASLEYWMDLEFGLSIKIGGSKLPGPASRLKCISGDFGMMLKDTKSHDLKILCEGDEMTAHKCILAGRSRVFKAMFESDMKEAKESVVKINYASPGSVRGMLRWIYTCQIDDKAKADALDLIRLAHLYEMPLLMEEIKTIIISQIEKKNVFDILVVSDLVGAKEVKEAAIQFIVREKLAIVEMEEFPKKLSKELLAEIIKILVVKK